VGSLSSLLSSVLERGMYSSEWMGAWSPRVATLMLTAIWQFAIFFQAKSQAIEMIQLLATTPATRS